MKMLSYMAVGLKGVAMFVMIRYTHLWTTILNSFMDQISQKLAGVITK